MDLQYIIGQYPSDSNSSNVSGTGSQLVSDDGTKDFMHKFPWLSIPYLIVVVLGTFFGTIGNVLVICSVFINKNLRLVGNVFIVNLAIADLCVTSFVDPFSIIGITRGSQYFLDRYWLCELISAVCLTSCFCSLLTIGAVAFNRYIHICKTHLYGKIYTMRNSLLMIIILWTTAFLAEMPSFLGWGGHSYDTKTMSCMWDRTADFTYTLFISVGGVAAPVFLIAFCYLKIFRHVRASKKRVAGAAEENSVNATQTSADPVASKEQRRPGGSKRDSKKLARTLFTIFVVFAVCWMPYAVLIVVDFKDRAPQFWHVLFIMFAHTNSSLNCIVYALTNKHFKESYLYLLGITYCKNKLFGGVNDMSGITKLQDKSTVMTAD